MDARAESPLVLPNYPYRGKFTVEQVREALDRKDRIVEAMIDPVGPDGTLINIPVDMLHILAFHLAYAGADVHTDHRQLIESRLIRNTDSMFEIYEWRARGEFGTTPTADTEATTSEAADIAANMKQQLTPQVRAALTTILLEEYKAADRDISQRERAQNVLTEQREMKEDKR
jgi:hypothetical protein